MALSYQLKMEQSALHGSSMVGFLIIQYILIY